MSLHRIARIAAVLGTLGTLGTVGCGAQASGDATDILGLLPTSAPTSTVGAPTGLTPPPAKSATQLACEGQGSETASYRPDPTPRGDLPADSYMAEILRRGRLTVGVDETTLGFASRDPETGDIEGFEVELAREIARRIFTEGDADQRLVLVPVATTEKVAAAADGTVDLTIDAITMTCARWEQVAFSSEYYTATQQLLVRSDSPIQTLADLTDRPVCVTGSSSRDLINSAVERFNHDSPGAALAVNVVQQAERTDCLVALQDGNVDAYFSHESFLYGMLAQDPTLEIRRGVVRGEPSHYGMAVSSTHPEFVRFVNGVLAEISQDGTWSRLYNAYVAVPFGLPDGTRPPAPKYRD